MILQSSNNSFNRQKDWKWCKNSPLSVNKCWYTKIDREKLFFPFTAKLIAKFVKLRILGKDHTFYSVWPHFAPHDPTLFVAGKSFTTNRIDCLIIIEIGKILLSKRWTFGIRNSCIIISFVLIHPNLRSSSCVPMIENYVNHITADKTKVRR